MRVFYLAMFLDGQDVWCGPGIGFASDHASAYVDCVVASKNASSRRNLDVVERATHREEVLWQLQFGLPLIYRVKSKISGFEGFIRDKYTALPETRERMLATEVTGLWRYSYESLSSIPQKPFYFMERYDNVKRVLLETFFGPPNVGVYSPSIQSTLYQMARATLNRFSNIDSVQLKMPNIHFLPVNISNTGGQIVKISKHKMEEISFPFSVNRIIEDEE
ncbi:uricase-2 isozyme 1-like [Arachis stenosperma]|uniref:uricase-2 isozyme 1-like n=1 Tax=Arachis stenosperma TaxID=217475 RepID=UPI0025ACFDAE|nr:uricase-2 isozyme 1-like [Arachis stenosperma]